MQMVFDAEGLSPREKCILLAYCNYTDAHGYVWAGVPRVSDDSGASESTVKRVRKELQERGLLATKRRVDPRTGRSTSNITRINLDRLAAMKRAPREYDDNVIEELLFDAEPAESKNPADLRIVQSDLGPDLRIGQSDPGSGVNLTPPKGGVNLTPNPSDEPSGSSSSGSADTTHASNTSVDEEDETPSAGTQRGVLPMDLIVEATDATREEAQELVEVLRPEAKKSLGGLIRRMAEKGDLDHRLWLLRRQRAAQARTGASGNGRAARCAVHDPNPVPCGSCRADLAVGGNTGNAVVELYLSLGADAATLRPDLARHPKIAALTAV